MHSHHHHHHHTHTHSSFNTAFAIAITLMFAYTSIEAAYALLAHSMSLLADAAHNLGDALGLILAWIANWLLSKPASKRYSYGFKRLSILAALANAFILVGSSALIAFEAVDKLLHPVAMHTTIVIIVGTLGVLVNGGASLLFRKGAHSDLNIKGAFLHLLADAVLLIGVVVAAILIAYTNYLWIDPFVSLLIVGIILWGAWGLLRDSVNLILDGIPHYVDHIGVKNYLSTFPGVTAIHDLHIWGLSTREIALTAHLIMPERKLTDQDYQAINKVLHEQFAIHHITLQVESGHEDYLCHQSVKC